MTIYKVYYMKPEVFRDGIMGYDWLLDHGPFPDPDNLEKTHVFLREIEAKGLESVWVKMQGKHWSPNGEASLLIQEKGLRHTSMSVGDIAVDTSTGIAHMVDRMGFKAIQEVEPTDDESGPVGDGEREEAANDRWASERYKD